MDTSLNNLLTAYELAEYNLDVSLNRLNLLLQVYSEKEVNPTIFLTCMRQAKTVRELLSLLENWLNKQTDKE